MLSELDWKTLDNAEVKAMHKYLEREDDDDREKYYQLARKFGDARNKAFNDEFGFNDDDDSYGLTSHLGPNDVMRYVTDKRCDYPNPAGTHCNYFRGYDSSFRSDSKESLSRHLNGKEKLSNAVQRGDEELRNFYYGKYDYEPNGRGWHLKNSH